MSLLFEPTEAFVPKTTRDIEVLGAACLDNKLASVAKQLYAIRPQESSLWTRVFLLVDSKGVGAKVVLYTSKSTLMVTPCSSYCEFSTVKLANIDSYMGIDYITTLTRSGIRNVVHR